ncbi:MAG: hypothetical protein JW803_06545 [Endomicrobiales bacterium]|nr:hypothetical protein [Endomicrobiales bacterium]
MKRVLGIAVALMVTISAGCLMAAPKASKTKDDKSTKSEKSKQSKKSGFQVFVVYSDDEAKENHFTPSGWMGDYGDIRINQGWKETVHSGKTSIKLVYTAKMTQNAGWVGVYWQHPASNWGDKKDGFNLTGASRLTFWAKGEEGGETVTEFKVGGITGEFPDSDSAAIGPVELTKKWQKYSIELEGKDLTNVIGGFCWSASKDDNPNGMTIYIDDIQFE